MMEKAKPGWRIIDILFEITDMKNVLLCINLLFLGVTSISAQHETLIKDKHAISGFGALTTEFGALNKDYVTWLGGGGAVIIDDFFIGGFGTGTVRPGLFSDDEEETALGLAYGGVWLGYMLKGHKLVHFYTDLKLGWGTAVKDQEGFLFDDDEEEVEIFAVNPQAGIELNITNFFRICLTAGYRITRGIDDDDLEEFGNKDFSGPMGSLSFRFGGYSRRFGEE